MFDAGPVFDQLMDRLHDMGCPPARYGRVAGQCLVWLGVSLPAGHAEYRGVSLDAAARAVLDAELTCADHERAAASNPRA